MKNCKNEKLTIRKKSKTRKMSGQKNVKTKKYTTKKRGTKNHATKECGSKICGPKNLRRKLAGRKSDLTRNVCLGYFVVGKASELCVFKYLAKNNCYPQILSCLFPLEMMQIGRYCSWKLTVIFGSVRILANRVNCPCPEQGRNPNSQLSRSAISPSILPIEPQDHNQLIHRNPVNGLVMIFRFSW